MNHGGSSLRRERTDVALACLLLGFGAIFTLSCKAKPEAQPAVAASPEAPANSVAVVRPTRGSRVKIETTDFESGLNPGAVQRNPEWEPRSERVRLGAFEIDAEPFTDPVTHQVLLGASKDDATLHCGQQRGRLCTELEWELACRGPNNSPFSSGNQWRTECATGDCASDFGVFGLGARPEWTSSSSGERSPQPGSPLVRGAAKPQADDARCSRRRPIPAAETSQVGFRCCYGAPNSARVKDPEENSVVFEKLNLPPARLKELLASDDLTRPYAEDLKLFSDPEGPNTVISRGPGDRMGFDFTTSQLFWRPARGAEYLLVVVKSGKATSLVLAYNVLSRDRFTLVSSYILEDEAGPVTFAYSDSIRPRVHFSSCWGCPGETGKILFRAPESVVILQP